MRKLSSNLALICLTFVASCTSPSYQSVARPTETEAVGADRCRVYVARSDDVKGSLRSVRISDQGVVIGRIGDNEYLCWDRPAERGAGQVFYEGLDPRFEDVESLFDLPREGGTTTWFALRIGEQRKPEIVPLSADEGRALIAKRHPAQRK